MRRDAASPGFAVDGQWDGLVGEHRATLSLEQRENSLSGKIVYDRFEEEIRDGARITMKGIAYRQRSGPRSRFSLDTFHGQLSPDGRTMTGTYEDAAGKRGPWSLSIRKRSEPKTGQPTFEKEPPPEMEILGPSADPRPSDEIEGEERYLVTLKARLPGSDPVFRTGIKVLPGDTLRITARGAIRSGIDPRPEREIGPEGLGDLPDLDREYPLGPGSSFMQLICRVGENGSWYGLGSAVTARVGVGGNLHFSFNQAPHKHRASSIPSPWSGNSGSLDIEVLLLRANAARSQR